MDAGTSPANDARDREMTETLTAIVTGAAHGIGRAVALRLARSGVKVVAWDTQRERGEETIRECQKAGGEVHFWTVDVSDEAQVNGAVAEVVRRCGVPVRLVNNAGIFPRSNALDMDLAEWEHVFRVNLTGSFICARAVARRMIAAAAARSRPLASPCRGQVAVRTTPPPRRASSPLPSRSRWTGPNTESGLIASYPGSPTPACRAVAWRTSSYTRPARVFPLGPIGRAEEIAAVVAFLLGPDAAYMTGQSVAVNGGAIMLP
jgi:NAD(P)-dependent dehydrogenase (short-subunit alcohol dehydrogenase family)